MPTLQYDVTVTHVHYMNADPSGRLIDWTLMPFRRPISLPNIAIQD